MNYRDFLKNYLEKRAAKNPRYSLRAMANHLGISAGGLSLVLNGKKNFSVNRAMAISKALNLNEQDAELFVLLVQAEAIDDAELKASMLKRIHFLIKGESAQDLSLEHFRVISDWYHFALMALTELTTFHFTPASTGVVAKALGISRTEVERALERLEKLEMIELQEGLYIKTQSNPRVVSAAPNTALRKYHTQTLEKAIASLETQTPQEKFIGSETFAIDESLLKEFNQITEVYFSNVLELAKRSRKKNHVYHLGVQFFKMTGREIE